MALASQPLAEAPVSPCDVAIIEQAGSNVLALGKGANACEEEGRAQDAAFLDLLARIRATADLLLLPPEDVLDLGKRKDFRAVFAGSSEFVDEAIARDPERFAALLDRVRKADLTIPATYDPGWVVADRDKRAIYTEVIEGLRTDRLAMETYIAMLVRDEAYYAAYRERVAMLRAPGQELPERFDEVAEIMKARVAVLGDPPSETAVLWRKVFEPAPDAPFTVLHRGFNGPAQSDASLFRSAEQVQKSWVSEALSEEELAQLLSRIDFATEILGVYAVGEMPNASENLFVTEFGPRDDLEGHSIDVRVGVVGEQCGFAQGWSCPFVLVKASSQIDEELMSTSRANYPDQCVPVMAGEPTPVVEKAN
jgi:hypothetical protein